MTIDEWYALRGAATKYRADKETHRAHFAGTIRRVRAAGIPWHAVARAAGMAASTVQRIAA